MDGLTLPIHAKPPARPRDYVDYAPTRWTDKYDVRWPDIEANLQAEHRIIIQGSRGQDYVVIFKSGLLDVPVALGLIPRDRPNVTVRDPLSILPPLSERRAWGALVVLGMLAGVLTGVAVAASSFFLSVPAAVMIDFGVAGLFGTLVTWSRDNRRRLMSAERSTQTSS